jgi:hypothetical protein
MPSTRRPGRNPLRFQQLESRDVPSTFGVAWPDGKHLRLSFTPDGTADGSTTSKLFQNLSADLPSSDWQLTILRAFQTWAVNANVNIGVVADGGQAIETPGPLQGDPRFGDIRIEDLSLGSSVGAISSGFNLFGSGAGTVRFNSDVHFSNGIQTGALDLLTVAIHEAGHALGIGDNTDPTSVEYQSYQGVRTVLSAGDIAILQSLYGARSPDGYEGKKGNDTFSQASSLSAQQWGVVADADLTTSTDVDYYKFNADPRWTNGFTVTLHTSGLSLLQGRITLLDQNGNVIATAQEANPTSGDVSIQVPAGAGGTTYYVKVDSPTKNVFGIGGYQLQVLSGLPGQPTPATTTVLSEGPSGNNAVGGATDLNALQNSTAIGTQTTFRSAVDYTGDVDFYRVHTPDSGPKDTRQNVLVATVWGTDGNLVPTLNVYDAKGNLVPSQVLVADSGVYSIQVVGAANSRDYYVGVRAGSAGASVGGYMQTVYFTNNATSLSSVGAGLLTAAQPVASQTLKVATSQVAHFVLTTQTANSAVASALRMTILDSLGNAVFTMAVAAGNTVTADVTLAAGTYTIVYAGKAQSEATLPLLGFSLAAVNTTDPIGLLPIGSGGSTGTPITTTPIVVGPLNIDVAYLDPFW